MIDIYTSFDDGEGKKFKERKLSLEQVVDYAKMKGEPKITSWKQELYEAIFDFIYTFFYLI